MRYSILFLLFSIAGTAYANVVLESFDYSENFETRTLRAWASYPLWQDAAYDPNFRVNEIVPGDPNISIEQKVTPYTNVDNYAGAQKLFDAYLTPESSITLRYYLKSHLPFEFFKVRIAAGPDGKVDFTVPNPPLNRWVWLTVTWDDFVRENPNLAGRDRIKVNALAVYAKVSKADPDMPFYLCLDDVAFKGARAVAFRFDEPEVYKLSEFKLYIPKKHYTRGDQFSLSGRWPLDADRVEVSIASYTHPEKIVLTRKLKKQGDQWRLNPLNLSFPDGLYLGTLRAFGNGEVLSETPFTVHIAPKNIGGTHPRLWFDAEKKKQIEARLASDRFKKISTEIADNAKRRRESLPVELLAFDLDQFPDERWLPTWSAWGSHIYPTGDALYWNSLAYTFLGDRTAGEYAKDVLVKLAKFDNWTHPWQTKRGRFSEHRSGAWSHSLSLAYDLTYDLMTENERVLIRKAFMTHLIGGVHKTYVINNNVTCNTSNWIAHVAGGSIMMQAAIFGDGPDVANLEPCFTGAAMKLYDFIEKVMDPDGAWGEGLGYNGYSFRTMAQSLPSLMNVFNIDMSRPLNGSYREYIWAGPVKAKQYFYYGDTGGNLNPIPDWAWLLDRNRDPLLGWYYNFLKFGDFKSNTTASIQSYMSKVEGKHSIMDVLYETLDVPVDDPFDENPVRCFRGVGTTVFKSGWEPDDFIFVMRTGPFYNHQHLDQGTFWLADRGSLFFEERHGSTYYDDPLYQPWYTQPVAHSTILIDGNHQSQRTGDHLTFAEGFEDYATVTHFLDGTHAAFVTGDIGRLYFGAVEGLRRNVLYLKPRTLLMLDTVDPADRDVDVTLLYQTQRLQDIVPGGKLSKITKTTRTLLGTEAQAASSAPANTLFIRHLFPKSVTVKAVETPHYLHTLNRMKPLVKEGMLTVTAKTAGAPLVVANLLTTDGETISGNAGNGFVSGTVNDRPYAFSTIPGGTYTAIGVTTDALAVTGDEETVFAAQCRSLSRGGVLLLETDAPMTCEFSPAGVKYYRCSDGEVSLGVPKKPSRVRINGKKVSSRYDAGRKAVVLTLPAGEGMVTF